MQLRYDHDLRTAARTVEALGYTRDADGFLHGPDGAKLTVPIVTHRQNAFHEPGDPQKLSKTARGFIAGLLVHAREVSAVTNQWVNSYKRLFGQPLANIPNEAPAYVCWGSNNRSALVRVPNYKPGKANSTRVEVRSLDVEQLGDSSFLVRLVLQNSGWLPTNVTEKALERKAVRELEVELELPEGARLVGGEMKTDAGQLKGRVEKRAKG